MGIFKTNKNSLRVAAYDLLRGILMIWVMVDHFLYDAGYMFFTSFKSTFGINLANFGLNYFNGQYRSIAHPIVLALFFLISGIVSRFSRGSFYRVLKYFIVAVAIFTVTEIYTLITKDFATIIFGIMFVFTVCALFYFLLEKIKTPSYVYLILGVIIATFGLLNDFGVLKLGNDYTFVFFDYTKGYEISADYFPLFPYLGYFFIGIFLGKVLYKEKKAYLVFPSTLQKCTGWLSFIGKTSLWWYLGSQVVFILLFNLLILLGV